MRPELKIDSSISMAEFIAEPTEHSHREECTSRKQMDGNAHWGLWHWKTRWSNMAVVTILNQIYEEDFLGFSYGFRPGRCQHDALDALSYALLKKKVNYVLDADIRGFACRKAEALKQLCPENAHCTRRQHAANYRRAHDLPRHRSRTCCFPQRNAPGDLRRLRVCHVYRVWQIMHRMAHASMRSQIACEDLNFYSFGRARKAGAECKLWLECFPLNPTRSVRYELSSWAAFQLTILRCWLLGTTKASCNRSGSMTPSSPV
jgi:hypothetical protein